MQRPPSRYRLDLRRDQSTGLQFPTLSFDQDLDHWFEYSQLIPQQRNRSMASFLDDSSVDENVSSVGGSTWDMVDEASAASEDDADRQTLPRHHKSESIENLHLDAASFIRSKRNRSEEHQEWNTPGWNFESVQRQELQTTEEVPASPGHYAPVRPTDSFQTSSAGGLRLDEVLADAGNGVRLMKTSVVPLRLQQPQKSRERCQEPYPVQSVVMGLKADGLVVSETFKFLYIGPREMKPLITQKIGSAIAANPRRMSLKDGLDSSRVTVVPVSALFDDSNPEVVMIESGGFDMNIEECTSAFQTIDEKGEILTMELDSQRSLKSMWEYESDKYSISNPEHMPDLAVFYQPAGQSVQDDLTTYWASRFLALHRIPFYFLSADGDSVEPQQDAVDIDIDIDIVPHREIETWSNGQLISKKSVTLDLSSFLALDASQLHQNIVALKTHAAAAKIATKGTRSGDGQKKSSSWLKPVQKKWQSVPAPVLLKFVLPTITVALMLAVTLVARYFVNSQVMPPALTIFPTAQLPTAQYTSFTTSTKASYTPVPVTSKSLGVKATPKSIAAERPAKGILEEIAKSKPSRGTLVQVIGGSHILIRPAVPTKPARMTFKATRNNEAVPTLLKSFDGEYYVLEIPSSDAFGLVEIHVQSKAKPKFEETIEVDLGSPWLKPKYWQHIAQSISNQSVETASHIFNQIQSSSPLEMLTDFYYYSDTAQVVRKDVAVLLNTMEKVQSWSISTLRPNMKAKQRYMKHFRRSIKKLKHKAQKSSMEVVKIYETMYRYLASAKSEWARNSAGMKKPLDMSQLLPIRTAQKKLLHAWWSIRGRPVAHEV